MGVPDAKGRLQYTTDARGNRIMDFSHAGYKGGGVRIPDVSRGAHGQARLRVTTPRRFRRPSTRCRSCPVDANGFRGAVLLERGSIRRRRRARIAASGVVLRGSGSGDERDDAPRHGRAASGRSSWAARHVAARRHAGEGHRRLRARRRQHA